MASNTALAPAPAPAADELLHEFGPLLRVYKSGRIERPLVLPPVAPGPDPSTGVQSKDVDLGAYSARLYLPPSAAAGTAAKLPVIVYVHGGGFVAESAKSPNYHRFLNDLTSACPALGVSLDYRLAPEHPLPAAYDDCLDALRWVLSAADPWVAAHGDLGRVFVAGASAGGNIAHNMAIAAGASGLFAAATRLEGAVLLHPSFSGERRIETESEEYRESVKMRCSVIFPGARGGLDNPRMNPTADGAPSLRTLPCERMLVSAASEDARLPRIRAYYDAVKSSGWSGQVEWFESEGKEHAFFVDEHGCREAVALMERVAGFIAGH